MSKIEHEVSSGNVFADIGMAEPVELLAKAELARKIGSIIKHRSGRVPPGIEVLAS